MDNVEWVDLSNVQALHIPESKKVVLTEFTAWEAVDIQYEDLDGLIKFLTKVRNERGIRK